MGMDDVDAAICRLLLMNARMPYSVMGREVGMSPQAVHRRVRSLIDAEIITGSGTYLTHKAMGRLWVLVHGWSSEPSMSTVADRLGGIGAAVMFIASGNMIYVHGSVDGEAAAGAFAERVRELASLEGVSHAVVLSPPGDDRDSLSRLDLRIAKSLQLDARRPLTEVSEEVGASVKTVRRRLAGMVERGLVHMSIHWEPDTQGDVISNIHLGIGGDRERAAFVLIKRLGGNAMRTISLRDHDDRMVVTVWTRNVRDMQSICDDLESEGVFESVVPHIIRRVHYFEENRHRDLDDMLDRSLSARP